MQGFLDIVLTECDKHAATQVEGDTAASNNLTAPHWAAVYADEERLVSTNNFNFLPVRSVSAPGVKRRLSARSVGNKQKRTSLSLNPSLRSLKKDGLVSANVARRMSDVRKADTVVVSSTWGGVFRHQDQSTVHTKAARGMIERPIDQRHDSRTKQERSVALHHLLDGGEFPERRSRPQRTNPTRLERLIQKRVNSADSHPCPSSEESKSTSTCKKTGRSLKGN